MADHIVRTTHIQHLIENGLRIAKAVDGAEQRVRLGKTPGHWSDLSQEDVHTIDALEKAAADLRHAAEELTAERLSLLGWPQT